MKSNGRAIRSRCRTAAAGFGAVDVAAEVRSERLIARSARSLGRSVSVADRPRPIGSPAAALGAGFAAPEVAGHQLLALANALDEVLERERLPGLLNRVVGLDGRIYHQRD